MGSYVFVQRFLLFSAAVVLFFVQEVHAPALLFHLLLGYHLTRQTEDNAISSVLLLVLSNS